jgi:Fur family transcriptional regulator, ferric uptake regulator
MSSVAAHEILTQFLKKQGKLRATPSRFAVLDAVLQIQGHFDAEGLYYRMISQGQQISKATVYNTLDLLQECGLVSKYRFTENSSRYEKAYGKPQHHHLICLSCGDIVEFVSERLEVIREQVCADNDFTPQSSSLQVFGTCKRCKKR